MSAATSGDNPESSTPADLINNQYKVVSAGNTGAAATSIPINVPPGINGMQPNLSLSYNSYGRNGWVGVGWSLGIGSIQRNIKRGVDYSADDYVFKSSGAISELVEISMDGCTKCFSARIEGSFSKYEYISADNRWVVTSKNGTKYFYGKDPFALYEIRQNNDIGDTFKWPLVRVEDTNGNYMEIKYFEDTANNQLYLDEIRYTGNSTSVPVKSPIQTVKFIRDNDLRYDKQTVYTIYSAVKTVDRLDTIEISTNETLVRSYKLEYILSDGTKRSMLNSVTQYSGDGTTELIQTDLSWFHGRRQMDEQSIGPNYNYGYFEVYKYPFFTGDFDGDGKADLARVRSYKVQVGLSDAYGYFTRNDLEGDFSPENNYENVNDNPLVIGDFNGDGKTDMGRVHATGVKIYSLDENNIWVHNIIDEVGGIGRNSYTGGIDNNYPMVIGDFNGDGITDIGRVLNDEITFQVGSRDGTWSSIDTLVSLGRNDGYTNNKDFPVVSGDFNGDGRVDVGRVGPTSVEIHLAANGGTWVPMTDLNDFGKNSYSDNNKYPIMTGDYNGDGKTDVARVVNDGVKVYLSTGADWILAGQLNEYSPAQGINSNYYNPVVSVDINGDGRSDIGRLIGDDIDYYSLMQDDGLFVLIATSDFNWNTIEPAYSPLIHADLNGDGGIDTLVTTGTAAYSNEMIRVLLSGPANIDLLSGIDNGLGGHTDIVYKASSKYDNGYLPFSVKTVKSVTVDDGRGALSTTNYTYFGGYYSADEREFRGFATVTATDADNGTYAETMYLQDDDFKGFPEERIVRDIDDVTYVRTFNTYEAISPYPGVTYPYLKYMDDFIYDGDEVTPPVQKRMEYDYDDYGNLTMKYSHGFTSVAGDERA